MVGILQLINFAHGDVYMFGTFVAMALLLVRMRVPGASARVPRGRRD